jgi:hypothetical protein
MRRRRQGGWAGRAGAALLGLALVLASKPAGALFEAEKGDTSVEAIGNIRLTTAYLRYPDVPELYPGLNEGLVAAVVRLILDGTLGARINYDLNLYADMSRMPAMAAGSAFATAGSFRSPYRTRYLAWDYVEKETVSGQMGVDRFSLVIKAEPVTVTVGRFPVNDSITLIFTPNDFFAPFSATTVNKVYKPGVDALRLGVTLGMLSSLELTGVLGYGDDDVPDWGRSALMTRISAVKWNFEWALMGGKVAERWIAGASIQGEAGLFGLHAEAHAGFPDRNGDGRLDDVDGDGEKADDIHGRVAGGFNILFAWHNVTLGAEYMFISDGASRGGDYAARVMRLYPDDIPTMGRHYVGLSAGGEIIPILMLQTMALFNVSDHSGLGMVSLVCSAADEIEFVAGVLIPFGPEPSMGSADILGPAAFPVIESEFGSVPLMAFLEGRFYF